MRNSIAWIATGVFFLLGLVSIFYSDGVREYFFRNYQQGVEKFGSIGSYTGGKYPGPWFFRLLGFGFVILSIVILGSLFRKTQ
jgi:hypothetical protein